MNNYAFHSPLSYRWSDHLNEMQYSNLSSPGYQDAGHWNVSHLPLDASPCLPHRPPPLVKERERLPPQRAVTSGTKWALSILRFTQCAGITRSQTSLGYPGTSARRYAWSETLLVRKSPTWCQASPFCPIGNFSQLHVALTESATYLNVSSFILIWVSTVNYHTFLDEACKFSSQHRHNLKKHTQRIPPQQYSLDVLRYFS